MANSLNHIYQHYSKEEKNFVEKMSDLCQQVADTYSYRTTQFLNPRQEQIVQDLANRFDLQVFSSGSVIKTEFVRLIIAPDYYELNEADFEIAYLEVHYPVKYYQLTHAQVLGSLLNRLGIRRDVLGDILLDGERILVCIDRRFQSLVIDEVTKISRVPVSWQELSPVEWGQEKQSEGAVLPLLVSSLRIDQFITAGFRLSRSQATKLIQSGRVKQDYSTVDQASSHVIEGQLISVRGYGRLRLLEQTGVSRQGKLKVTVEVIRKHQ